LKIVIGTTNPSKIHGVLRAFKIIGIRDYIALPIKGFEKQPIGLKNIYFNAVKRVVEASKHLSGNKGFAVAVEAGVIDLDGFPVNGEICIITDTDKYSVGLSSFFPIPRKWRDVLKKGFELRDLVRSMGVSERVLESVGAIGYLTLGYVSRSDLTYQATINALIPWLNPDLEYDLPSFSLLIETLKSVDSNYR